MQKVYTFDEYKKHALRSIKPHDSKEMAIMDWILGIGGESSEVLELYMRGVINKMTVAKEIGDIIWYITAFAAELDIDLKEFPEAASIDQPPAALACAVSVTAGKLQEAIKHYFFHKEKSSRESIEIELDTLFEQVSLLCSAEQITINDCAKLNAAKLAHRFNLHDGGEYNTADSENRHKKEIDFKETATYKKLVSKLTGITVEVSSTDLEVL